MNQYKMFFENCRNVGIIFKMELLNKIKFQKSKIKFTNLKWS